jgi:hypothetical protein
MFLKNNPYYLILVLLCISCAPSFNVEQEQLKIQNATGSLLDIDKRIAILYPKNYNTDSLKNSIQKLIKNNQDIVETLKKDTKNATININKVSNPITIQDRLFRIVNTTESFTILKKDIKIAYDDFENYFESNLYTCKEYPDKYTVTGSTDFIAIDHNHAWEYFNFNIAILLDAYGMTDTKKLVQLYYDEIFEPNNEKWDAQRIKDFKEVYSKNKNLPQHKNRDFDAYCDCLIQHEEKLDPEKVLAINYYKSKTYHNSMLMCRIISSRE